MTLKKIICGFQNGADIAGADAAVEAELEVGGTMPLGWMTCGGARPEYAGRYGAVQADVSGYPHRTRKNIDDSDATLVFNLSTVLSGGTTLAIGCGRIAHKEVRVVSYDARSGFDQSPADIARWIESREIETLNIAGNRDTDPPTVYPVVKVFLDRVIRILRDTP